MVAILDGIGICICIVLALILITAVPHYFLEQKKRKEAERDERFWDEDVK